MHSSQTSHISLPSHLSSSYHLSNTTPSKPANHPNENRKHERPSWPRHPLARLFLLTICFSSLIPSTTATQPLPIPDQMIDRSPLSITEPESLGSTFARLARSGTIIVDPRAAPEPRNWGTETDTNLEADLQRRNNNVVSSSSSAVGKTNSSTATSPLASSTATSSGAIAAATSTAMASLPVPFDTGFNNNITAGCATFMGAMLGNATFKSCLPFSLLLQNSNSFFQASKSLVRITQTLDSSCSAPLPLCTTLLTTLATTLSLPSNCGPDLTAQNPTIKQAHLGLLAYPTLYSASCLRNPSTSSYCFADAITNASNSADPQVYFLPLNVSLGAGKMSCSDCLRNTMGVFHSATGEGGSAIRVTYGGAATQVNVFCGPGFVNASLAAVVVASSSLRVVPGSGLGTGVWVLLAMMAGWLL